MERHLARIIRAGALVDQDGIFRFVQIRREATVVMMDGRAAYIYELDIANCRPVAILTLVVKHKWYEMIRAGVKKEEYREIKQWCHQRGIRPGIPGANAGKMPDAIMFQRGYSSLHGNLMLWRIGQITIGKPKPGWADESDMDKEFNVIHLSQELTDGCKWL